MPHWSSKIWIRVLALTLCVQVLLAVALAYRAQRQGQPVPQRPLVEADWKSIDRLVLEGPSGGGEASGAPKAAPARIELVRQDSHWKLPGSYDAPANDTKVNELLQKLAQTRRGAPIGTSNAALRHFRVADDDYERHLVASAGARTLAELRIGSSIGLRKNGVRIDAESAVYAVDLSSFEAPVGLGDWLDPNLLRTDPESLAKIEIVDAKGAVLLERAVAAATGLSTKPEAAKTQPAMPSAQWQSKDRFGGHPLNAARAAELAQALGRVRYDAVMGKESNPDWNQDQPLLRLTLTSKDGQAVAWTISKSKTGGDYALKASDKPWYLRLKEYEARPILQAADREKLFAPANPTRPGSA